MSDIMRPVDKYFNSSSNLLSFTGERSKPSLPSYLQARPPILGKGPLPADLIRLGQTREHYIQSSSSEVKPEIKLERIHDVGDHMWRVQILDASQDVMPGRTASRERPEKIVSEIDPGMSFTG